MELSDIESSDQKANFIVVFDPKIDLLSTRPVIPLNIGGFSWLD